MEVTLMLFGNSMAIAVYDHKVRFKEFACLGQFHGCANDSIWKELYCICSRKLLKSQVQFPNFARVNRNNFLATQDGDSALPL